MLDITPVIKQLDAYNQRDINSFMANFSVDCVVKDATGKTIMTGFKAMYDSYSLMFSQSPNLHCEIVKRIVVGNYVLDEEKVTGRHNNAGISHVVAIYHLENNLIKEVIFIR